MGFVHAGDASRHADGEAAFAAEARYDIASAVEVHVTVSFLRGGFSKVECVFLTLGGAVDEESSTPEVACAGIDDG